MALLLAGRLSAAQGPILLEVDARDTGRRVLHAALRIPADPGPLTLVYPKWIPGEHGPTGPIRDLAALKFTANGKTLRWQRDTMDLYAFTLQVPSGAEAVEANFDFLLPTETQGQDYVSTSANIAVINWNTVVLYPSDAKAAEVEVSAGLRLPDNWSYAAPLQPRDEKPSSVRFQTVSLETLVDSPVIAGAYLRTYALDPKAAVPHRMSVVGDFAASVQVSSGQLQRFANMVTEADVLFGSRPYTKYDFLLTVSDQVANFGLEHHECSDSRLPERMFKDPEAFRYSVSLVPHEFAHAWNGKYRRPAGMVTPNFQEPMRTDLLWVYEGLGSYLGDVIAARSGLWSTNDYQGMLALMAAQLGTERGRDWRPLVDTATAASTLYEARSAGKSRRRGVDFYPEGELVWLEADIEIRESTQGQRSLDDFCRAFFGGEENRPRVSPYRADELYQALNKVAAVDWEAFFKERVYWIRPEPPVQGIERGGWRLVYSADPTPMFKAYEAETQVTDLSFSIGLTLDAEGYVTDVIPGSAADRAGIGPAMTVETVNKLVYKPEHLRSAIRDASRKKVGIELMLEAGGTRKLCRVNYHEGERYPRLQRITNRPDLITRIIRPRGQ